MMDGGIRRRAEMWIWSRTLYSRTVVVVVVVVVVVIMTISRSSRHGGWWRG